MWIGLKTMQSGNSNEGQIAAHWSDGNALEYENFAEGWPNYADKKEKGDCVYIIGEDDPEKENVRKELEINIKSKIMTIF